MSVTGVNSSEADIQLTKRETVKSVISYIERGFSDNPPTDEQQGSRKKHRITDDNEKRDPDLNKGYSGPSPEVGRTQERKKSTQNTRRLKHTGNSRSGFHRSSNHSSVRREGYY